MSVTPETLGMTLSEAKAYLGDRYVLSPNYRPEDNPQHSLYEAVNIQLTFAHVRHEQRVSAKM